MAKFIKGQSGNPSGRPRIAEEVRDLARKHTVKAIETLVSIMDNPEAADTSRVAAAIAILDRGYGKPHQTVEGNDTEVLVIKSIERHILPAPRSPLN